MHEPTTLTCSVQLLRIFDDSLAIREYDVPENRFRQLIYHNHNTRAINCILSYRPLAILNHANASDASNFEYECRFENSFTLVDVTWLPYHAVQHTFAFEAFYRCISHVITGHQGVAIPSIHRTVHQSRASTANSRRRAAQPNVDAALPS